MLIRAPSFNSRPPGQLKNREKGEKRFHGSETPVTFCSLLPSSFYFLSADNGKAAPLELRRSIRSNEVENKKRTICRGKNSTAGHTGLHRVKR